MSTSQGVSVYFSSSAKGSISIYWSILKTFGPNDIDIRFECWNKSQAVNFSAEPSVVFAKTMRRCKFALFFFDTSVDDWERQEYEVAKEFQQKQLLQIIVYFLRMPETEKEASVASFQQQLKNDGQQWTEFDTLEEIKHQFAKEMRNYFKITEPVVPDITATESSGDKLFEQMNAHNQGHNRTILNFFSHLFNSQKKEFKEDNREQMCQQMHHIIDNVMVWIGSFKEKPADYGSANFAIILNLYKKVNLWAEKSGYDKNKHEQILLDYIHFLSKNRRDSEAEKIHLQRIALLEELYGINHYVTANAYKEVGMMYYLSFGFKKALEFYNNILSKIENTLGKRQPAAANIYYNIGDLYSRKGDLLRAFDYYSDAYKIYKDALGPDHNNTKAAKARMRAMKSSIEEPNGAYQRWIQR
ncbi:MAG: tetratricopeptide repeat protein [Bacteroidales bacterium]|nr:tetratricopeptide repeat protein [Bacteroidales bacterium]